MRRFSTGATRDTDKGKLDYECISPLFLGRFAEFMGKHRTQADGKQRSIDNWKLGIPSKEYFKSELRHVFDLWLEQDGFEGREDIEDTCCAIFFNIQGFMHNRLREQHFAAKREGNVRKRVNLKELVKKSKKRNSTNTCWARCLTGDLARYVKMLEEETKKGDPPVYRRVSEILREEFNFKMVPSAIRYHFVGECQCSKEPARPKRRKK
jgi:hypothetical protein